MPLQIGDKVSVEWTENGSSEKSRGRVIDTKERPGKKTRYHLKFRDGSKQWLSQKHITHYEILKRKKEENGKKSENASKRAKDTKGKGQIPDFRRILAPMVGASELPFRLLCRKYGATLAYTPMINSERFVLDEEYRAQEFQTCSEDHPLVAHFSANNPHIFLAAAKLVQDSCEAIDLNLGCPQRVAFQGHYGSFLLDEKDRKLVLSMVNTVSQNISIPLFVKIRLLDSVAETIRLVTQLRDAGAALVAIHARYRVNLVERSGPGARDGPAHLNQVKEIRAAVPGVVIISNGNVRCHEDCEENVSYTGADGVMTAEGILDNPQIFVPPADQKATLEIATEYLDLVEMYPTKLRTVVFHIRYVQQCHQQLDPETPLTYYLPFSPPGVHLKKIFSSFSLWMFALLLRL
jgi:tRNA-dihydrouridine synthase 1